MKNSYKSGEIILISFPFTDLSEKKVRPALILRDQIDSDILLAPISTTNKSPKNVFIIQKFDYEGCELPVVSCVRYQKLFTLDADLVLKSVSGLKEEVMKEVKGKVVRFIEG